MRVYVAGPMHGVPGYNFPAFDAAAAYLRALGHDAVNPADLDRDQGFDGSREVTPAERKDMLRRDFFELVSCDAIALLPGWEYSRGARAERRVADECGIDVYNVVPWVSFKVEAPALLVGLAGPAQSGKDTAGAMMAELAGFERIAFADPLKNVALACDSNLRHAVHGAGWEAVKREHPYARVFLQHLGVAVRDHVDPDAWVRAAINKAQPGGRYVFTDCRFPNEVAAIRQAGGYVVRVERPGVGPANDHISEHALSDVEWDAVLRNTGSLDDLRGRVRLFLSTI